MKNIKFYIEKKYNILEMLSENEKIISTIYVYKDYFFKNTNNSNKIFNSQKELAEFIASVKVLETKEFKNNYIVIGTLGKLYVIPNYGNSLIFNNWFSCSKKLLANKFKIYGETHKINHTILTVAKLGFKAKDSKLFKNKKYVSGMGTYGTINEIKCLISRSQLIIL